jgi:Ca2+-binding EF-hand superfamily protein
LLSKYKQQNGLVNYADFCNNVDVVFNDSVDPVAVIESSKSTANFTNDDKDTLLALLSAIRTEIMNKRILIKPQLQDYDRTKSCHITAEQFRRVMKELNLIPPTEELFQLLIRKYLDKGNIREINYFMFCADIDRSEDIFPRYIAKNPKEINHIYHGQLRDAGSTFF